MIQCCGGGVPEDNEYSLTIAMDKYGFTVDGLSKEDLLEIKSCIECMIEND